ncbi:hypothetical protein HR12_34625 [Microbacterium sp. SUBG005]|nr:hypothetical protein HR12_34625 [Microbacterium sp. SUBG005]
MIASVGGAGRRADDVADVGEQSAAELRRTLEVHGVPGPLDGHLGHLAALLGVRREHVPGLRDHRLSRRDVGTGPPGHHAEGTEVVEVVERGVRDDRVGGAVDPQDGAAG